MNQEIDNIEKGTEQEQNIEAALEALTAIRETVRGNMQIIRPLFIDRRFGALFLWMGIGCTILFGCLTFAEFVWNGTSSAPAWAKLVFGIVCAALLTATSIKKIIIIDSALKERDKSFNTIRFSTLPEIKAMLTDALVTMAAVAVLCVIIARASTNWWVFLPGFYLLCGFIFLFAANRLLLSEYRILGIFAYAFAVIISIFMKTHYGLWTTGSIALFSYISAGYYYLVANYGEKPCVKHPAE